MKSKKTYQLHENTGTITIDPSTIRAVERERAYRSPVEHIKIEIEPHGILWLAVPYRQVMADILEGSEAEPDQEKE